MADRIPLRIVYVNGVPTIGEFQSGDTLGVEHGGTGTSSLLLLKNDLGLNSLTLSGDLEDIDPLLRAQLISPSVGDSLVWNGSYWTTSGLQLESPLSSLTDVNITSVVNGETLVYFSSTGEWKNAVPISGGSAVDHGLLTGLGDNDHPQYVLSATNLALSSLVSSIEASTVALSSYIQTNSGDHGLLTGLLDNDHPQYVLSSVFLASAIELSAQMELNEADILDIWEYLFTNAPYWGGDLSAVDHSILSGLLDNDHPQYVLSATNQALSSLVTSVEGSTVDISSYIAANEGTWSTDNDTTDHTQLTNIGTNTHAQIDGHISDITKHFTVASIDHGSIAGLSDNDHPQYVLSSTNQALSSLVTSVEGSTVDISSYIAANEATWSTDNDTTDHTQLTNIGTNTHAQIDGHISDITKHFTVASIDHGSIAGLGDNDHPQYVLSSTNQALSSLVTSVEGSTVSLSSYIAANESTWSTDTDTTDHTQLTNIGTNTHAQIDGHISDITKHFTVASIDHGSIAGLGDNDHPQYVLSATNQALSSLVTSVEGSTVSLSSYIAANEGTWSTDTDTTDHTALTNIGTNTHAQIDGHISDITKHFTVASIDHGSIAGLGDNDHPQYVLSATNSALSSQVDSNTSAIDNALDLSDIVTYIEHGDLNGLGDNDHPQYVLSSTNQALSSLVTSVEGSTVSLSSYIAANEGTWSTDTDTTDHTQLTNIGTNTHAQIDGHISDITKHFTVASIDHGSIAGLGDNDHPQYVLSATNQALSSLVTSVEGSTVDISAYIAANEAQWATDVNPADHSALNFLDANDHPQYVLSATNQALSSTVTSKVNKELVGHYIEPWEEGSGHQNDPLGWTSNGLSSLREFDTDPFGNQSIVWKAIDTDVNLDGEGGFNSGKVPADVSSTYRFSCFIKQENAASGNVYFGPYGYSSLEDSVIDHRIPIRSSNAASGTGHIYKYFVSNQPMPSSDWYLAVAYLLPYQTETGPVSRQDTALYKASTGERVSFNIEDLMFDDPTAIALGIRGYHYNNPGGTGDAVQFFQPRIDIVDGNEPSIADLLGIVPRTDYVLTSTNSALSAQVDANTSAIEDAYQLSDIEAFIDHGNIAGLSDNDHPQYVLSATNQALSSLVTSIETSTVDISSYIAANEGTWSTDTDTTDHTQLTNIGTNTHAQIDGHIADITKHFTVASIDHGSIAGLGDNDHPQYVLSATNQALSSLVTSVEGSTVSLSSYIAANEAQWATDVNPADHSALNFLDANDHPQYVLSSTNQALSSLVDDHTADITYVSGVVDSKVNKEILGHYLKPWEEGSFHDGTGDGKWTSNGTSSLREFDTDPFGNQSIIWKAIDTDVVSDSEGGFNSAKVPADSSSTYRYSCFIKQENFDGSGNVYFGNFAYSNLSGIYNTDFVNVRSAGAASGTGNINPYFINNQQMPSSDWYLAVAYLHAYQTETGPSTRQETGIYKASTGEKVSFSNIRDLVFDDPSAVAQSIRAYHYYNPAGTGDVIQFFKPRIDLVDGNEPSITDLLGIVPRTDYVLSSTNSALSSLVTSVEGSTVSLSSYIAANESTWSTDNDTTDHTQLTNIGTNTHAQIDSHIADITKHFTVASIDHGSIAGLGDNDHPQYVLSSTNQALSSLVTSVEGSTVSLSGYIAANESTWSTDNDTTDHTQLSNIGTNTHAQIDGHISDITKHFTVASIDHGSIAGLGDNDHPQYVLSATNQALSSLITSVEGSTVSLSSYIAANESTWSTDNDTTDHTQLTNIGTNTHAQIDGHISDITKHFTVASIDHGSIAGLGDNDHPQYVLSSTNQGLSSLVTSVEGSTVSLSSYIAANEAMWSSDADVSTLSGLGDVNFTNLSAHQTLHYDGSAWVNEYNDTTEMRVRNGNASPMSRGDVIAIESAHNQNLVNVVLADASQTSAMPALGILAQDLAVGEEGIAITFGKAGGLNTSGFTEGTTVYVSPTTPGQVVNAKPSGVNELIQNVGIVMRSHQSNGVIKVTGIGRSNDIDNQSRETSFKYVNGHYCNASH